MDCRARDPLGRWWILCGSCVVGEFDSLGLLEAFLPRSLIPGHCSEGMDMVFCP